MRTQAPVLGGVGSAAVARSESRWMVTARIAWLALATFHVALSAVGLPLYLQALGTVCTGAGCHPWQPSVQPIGAWGVQLSVAAYAGYMFVLQLVHTAAFLGVAALLFLRRRTDWLALSIAATFVMIGTLSPPARQTLFEAYPTLGLAADFFVSVGWASFFVAFFYLFPNGRWVPRWARWLAPAWYAANLPAILSLERFAPSSALNYEHWHPALAVFVVVGLVGSGLFGQARRYRRADASQRRQIKWVVFGLAVAAIGTTLVNLAGVVLPRSGLPSYPALLYEPVGATLITVLFLAVPMSVAVAIMRHRLWDIDLIINRTLVYGALTAAITGLYVAVVAGLGALFGARGSLLMSLLAAGLIAVAFAPARERLQRAVNRLTYGHRGEPYEALARLGQRLEETLAPDETLSAVAHSVADALRLPYAAIELVAGGGARTVAAAGEPVEDVVRMPLHYGGEQVGTLTLAPRRGERGFSDADRRLLGDLARQIGVAVQALRASDEAVRLSAALQRSREGLVTAREEERRRLRRDLHDGLGPILGSLTLQLDVAADLVTSDPAAVEALLGDLKQQAQGALADIRRLVHGLRPPTLDDLGLVGAIQQQAARYEHDGLAIVVESSGQLGELPAAVDVAAYRITLEALTNVAHHAGAARCTIRAERDPESGDLHLEIIDDGRGIRVGGERRGVGLVSMRERAAELGGVCVIESPPGGGTRVCVRLPSPNADAGARR